MNGAKLYGLAIRGNIRNNMSYLVVEVLIDF